MKSDAELQLRAGMLLGDLQKEGYKPHEVVDLALTLVAYIIETQSPAPRVALEAALTALRERVQLPARN